MSILESLKFLLSGKLTQCALSMHWNFLVWSVLAVRNKSSGIIVSGAAPCCKRKQVREQNGNAPNPDPWGRQSETTTACCFSGRSLHRSQKSDPSSCISIHSDTVIVWGSPLLIQVFSLVAFLQGLALWLFLTSCYFKGLNRWLDLIIQTERWKRWKSSFLTRQVCRNNML